MGSLKELSVAGQERWERFLKNSPHGVVVFRALRTAAGDLDDFEWVALNQTAARTLRLPESELIGRKAREAHPEHLDPRIYRRLVVAHVTESVQEFEQPYPWPQAHMGRGPVPRSRVERLAAHSPHEESVAAWYAVTVIPLGHDELLVQFNDISHYKVVLKEAVELLNRDDLTGLANRRHAKSRFWVMRRRGERMTVLYFDLDGFKSVNDTHGHEVGDHVLGIIGGRLLDSVRPGELVARLGGDEFVVLLTGAEMSAVGAVTERLLEAIEEPIAVSGVIVQVSACVGAATYPEDGESFEALIGRADSRMYEEKRRRKAAS